MNNQEEVYAAHWDAAKGWKFLCTLFLAAVCYFLAPVSLAEPARRVLFIFVIAALFWALEVIPLYATSLIIIILEILLLCRPGGIMGMNESGYNIFLVPFGSSIIILFFGGFILAQALQKYHLDEWIARHLLKLFGSKPYFLMLGFMITTAFLSMWMSNTATTAMMLAMVLPLLKQLDHKDHFRTALILAIPFAANVGGMGTPVGTPPNAIAIGILADNGVYLNFIAWMKMAVPLVIVILFIISLILLMLFPSKNKEIIFTIKEREKFDSKSKFVGLISIFTVLLWLTSSFHKIPSAVVALLSVGLFFITGLLDKEDFKEISWDVLILMWGGLALGKGMEISGLTKWTIGLPLFQQHGFLLVAMFCFLAIILSTFISNTATANLLIPVVMAIPKEDPVVLATVVALGCSLAMALPVSTPPNAMAFSSGMLKSRDMMLSGIIVSAISAILILIGFQFVITKVIGG